jgi:mono-ADP-ribosyltransferase sirtuin 6
VRDHRTGRKCARCDGDLHDSIVNFGEDLPKDTLQTAYRHAKAADLCLVLGSSLTVTPASDVPATVCKKRKARLVICNLQETPLDYLSDEIRVHAKTDDLMVRVMADLGISIPSFILHRRMRIEFDGCLGDRPQLTVYGVDVDGTPVTFLRTVRLVNNRRVARSEPFRFDFRERVEPGTELTLELEFMGHYNEPDLEIVYSLADGGTKKTLYLLDYNPVTGVWELEKEDVTNEEEKTVSVPAVGAGRPRRKGVPA